MKYCTECRKVYPDTIEECDCQKDRYWKRGEIKSIPKETKVECKDCGSTEDLTYREAWYAGKYKFGDECTCRECRSKLAAEVARQEAMNYVVINNDDSEVEFYDGKTDVEDMLEDVAEEMYDPEASLNMIILKVEKVEGEITPENFLSHNTNIIVFDYEIYRVEEVIEPEVQYDGDVTINW